MSLQDDLSPSLGGDRASEATPEPPAEAPTPPPADQPAAGDDPFDFSALAALLTGPGAPSAETAEVIEALGRDVETFFTSAAQMFGERFPPAMAAFEGLLGAVEQALEPLFQEPPASPPSPPPSSQEPPL